MKQLKIMMKRLKNPSVILSITSQIVTLLLLLDIKIQVNIITGIITAICSILVLLGIMSNPTTQNSGYGDDIVRCTQCQKDTVHVVVNGKLVCSQCGCIYQSIDKT